MQSIYNKILKRLYFLRHLATKLKTTYFNSLLTVKKTQYLNRLIPNILKSFIQSFLVDLDKLCMMIPITVRYNLESIATLKSLSECLYVHFIICLFFNYLTKNFHVL